jgi:hypothetical protein
MQPVRATDRRRDAAVERRRAMSTRSKKRKQRRQELREAWEWKVVQIVRLREAARRPEVVRAEEFVERIEESPVLDEERSRGFRRRRRVYLKQIIGDERAPPPVRFQVPFSLQSDLVHTLPIGHELVEANYEPYQVVDFTWRQYALRAGDTDIRWYVPEVTRVGSPEAEQHAQYTARRAVAYIGRMMQFVEGAHWGPWALEELKKYAVEARSAIEEWMGETDPERTRAEREVSTGAANPR